MIKSILSNKKIKQSIITVLLLALIFIIFYCRWQHFNTTDHFFRHNLQVFEAQRTSADLIIARLDHSIYHILDSDGKVTQEEHLYVLRQIELLNYCVQQMLWGMSQFFLNLEPVRNLNLDVNVGSKASINLRIIVDYNEINDIQFYNDLKTLISSIQEIHERHPIDSMLVENQSTLSQIDKWLGFYNEYISNIQTWENMIMDILNL